MKSYIQVTTTTETREQAQTLAQHLVETKLAACVQITGPITSIYRWKGKVEKTQEWCCLIKTKDNFYNKVEAAIKNMHPYETPEIIAVPIVKGSKEYLKWIDDELREDKLQQITQTNTTDQEPTCRKSTI